MVTTSNVLSINMDAYCRLCGSEEGIRVSIFEQGTDHVKKIHKLLPITVNEHDPFPKTMCHRCSFKVNEFFEFRTTCIKAQEFFKSKVPWLRDKQQVTSVEQNHPPMVEVPLNSVDAISPNEKQVSNGTSFVDENEAMIVIEDSPNEEPTIQKTFLNENGTHDKIVMRIKKSDIKRKPKTRSMWDSKRRKRKPRKSCRIAQVFTTTLDEYHNIDNIENDPLRLSPTENIEHASSYSSTIKSPKQDHFKTENGVLAKESSVENISLPKYILVTNIPRVGSVYTCENCGRTFLSPQPATLHTCDTKEGVCSEEDNRSKESETMNNADTEHYSCNDCGKTFSRHSQLVTHQKKHSQADSSSDDNFTPFNHRRKHPKKRKTKPTLLTPKSFFTSFDQTEPGIMRHSLLSSDSD